MSLGIVKWFSNTKGYGFLTCEECDGDIFVHFSTINMDGYKTLRRGQKVNFELTEGPKGPHAVNIQPVEDATEQTELN
jgi:CspA family cold shock protein